MDYLDVLSGQYHLVVGNPPYLGSGKQSPILKEFLARNYPDSKTDLATAFTERCREFCVPGGAYALVVPNGWEFQKSYQPHRVKILTTQCIEWIVRLGEGAFLNISGAAVRVDLIIVSNVIPSPGHEFRAIDASKEGRQTSVNCPGYLSAEGRKELAKEAKRWRKDAEESGADEEGAYWGFLEFLPWEFRRCHDAWCWALQLWRCGEGN